LGKKYSNQSVAEQHSLDTAWNILMGDQFDTLRRYLFVSQSELLRFRQIVVNVVLATDIFDSKLGELRRRRWEVAFCSGCGGKPSITNSNDRGNPSNSDLRATIIIEHIIQASDVSHTMQHWHVYRKWNERLFEEVYQAYREGRMDKDPSEGWYKGELGFFDHYVVSPWFSVLLRSRALSPTHKSP
jgi:3'5'-cyclic nucleotide phosphodiesterase